MFEVGFSEILIVAVIALLVLGPEKLPKAARFTGLWMRRARAQWYSVKSEFEREMAQEELRKALAEPVAAMAAVADDLGGEMRALGQSARAPFEDAATVAAPLSHDPRPTPMHDPAPASPVDPAPANPTDPMPAAPGDPMPAAPGDPPAPAPHDPMPATPRDPPAPPA